MIYLQFISGASIWSKGDDAVEIVFTLPAPYVCDVTQDHGWPVPGDLEYFRNAAIFPSGNFN